jgi:glycosyltransferase involved in cell wall biosynthesis
MSIQDATKKKFFSRIENISLVTRQFFKRMFTKKKIKVFFRYYTKNTHPSFKRFYESPPIPWANGFRYDLAHWINYPAWKNNSPYIIEINDHPLSAVSYKTRGLHEPLEILNHIADAYDVYADKNCLKILMSDNGFDSFDGLFRHYFGDEFVGKFTRVNSPGCIPKIDSITQECDLNLGVACLASDFYLKGVDLVIDAWQSIQHRRGWKLYLACPNIPSQVLSSIASDSSIIITDKAPLSEKEKNEILSICSVTLAPTHVHGGANIIEGMEFGHVIIHFETHFNVFDDVGEKIDVPYHFYVPSSYGKDWKTFSEFRDILIADKKSGLFSQSTEDLAAALSRHMQNPSDLIKLRENVLKFAYAEYSLKNRNLALNRIYQSVVSQKE